MTADVQYNSYHTVQQTLGPSTDDILATQATTSDLGLTGIRYPAADIDRCVEGRTVDEVVSLILDGSEDLYPSARMYLASQEPSVLTTLYSSLHAYNLELHATILEYLLEENDASRCATVRDSLRTTALTKALYWVEYHYLSPSKAEATWQRYRRTAGHRAARRRRLNTDVAKPRKQGAEVAAEWTCSYQLFD